MVFINRSHCIWRRTRADLVLINRSDKIPCMHHLSFIVFLFLFSSYSKLASRAKLASTSTKPRRQLRRPASAKKIQALSEDQIKAVSPSDMPLDQVRIVDRAPSNDTLSFGPFSQKKYFVCVRSHISFLYVTSRSGLIQ